MVLTLCGFGVARADENLLARPVVIGASLSDGFWLAEMGLPFFSPLSKELGLHHAVERVRGEDGIVPNFGSNWMFVSTEAKASYQVKKALEAKPTVVFAVDFLFWYLYGNARGRGVGFEDLTRLQFFEKGLAHLASFDCPVVVGTIPDALESVGLIISPAQYPGKEVVDAANARLDLWLKEHPNVVKMDLAGFHRRAVANDEIKVGGKVFPAGETRMGFLQRDLMHPTQRAVDMIVEASLAALKAAGN